MSEKNKHAILKRHFHSKSILMKWVFSYIAVLLIPFIFFFYNQSVSQSFMRSEIDKANTAILKNVQESVDTLLDKENSMLMYAMLNQNFVTLRSSANLNAEFRYTAYKFDKDLQSYATSIGNNLSVLIYDCTKDYIIYAKNQSTANESANLYNVLCHMGTTLSYTEWKEVLGAEYATGALFVSDAFCMDGIYPCIVKCTTLRTFYGSINLFVALPLTEIEQLCGTLTDRYLLITDSSGNQLCSFGTDSAMEHLDLSLPSGSIQTGPDRNSYVCSYLPSGKTDWSFAIVTPEANYWSTLKTLRFFFTLSIGLSLLSGLFIAWMLLEQNYQPVRRIVKSIRPAESSKEKASENEFDLINQFCISLNTENLQMHNILDQQRDQARAQYLLSCLKGKAENLSNEDYRQIFQLDFRGKSFVLVLFSLGSLPKNIQNEYSDPFKYENINYFCVDNVFTELMQSYTYYKLEDGHLLIYLLTLDRLQQTRWDQENVTRLEQICTLFNEKLSLPLTAVLSEPVPSADALPGLYFSMNDAVVYKSAIGGTGLLKMRDYDQLTGYMPTVQQTYFQHLTSAVQNGDWDACSVTLDRIFASRREDTALSFSLFRVSLLDELYHVLSVFYRLVPDTQSQLKIVSLSDEVILSANEEEFSRSFHSFLLFACQTIRSQTQSLSSKTVLRIQDFVQANYADSSLNISLIADTLKKNPKYISRCFQEQTGVGLLDYINTTRIRCAIQILAQESITTEALAARVGYTNVRTFQRNFLHITQKTVSQYMEQSAK